MIKFNLKKIMKDKKVTLKELSSKTGLSINTLSLLSTGRSKGIQFDTLERIVNILECKIEDLIILDDGYNTLEILDVELIPKDDFFFPLKGDNNLYLKCTYLNEDRDVKKLLLTFNENTPLKGVMVNLAGDFPTEILTSEKHVKDIIGNKTMTSKLNLFVPFMALIFKKAYENNLFDFSTFPLMVNFMPYAEAVVSSTMWYSKNFNDDQFKNTGELKEYIEIEDYKLLISYDVYEYEIKEIKEGD
ncbi:helix-turn-helix domain-containing protein [Mammaliicoccus sciuri]|uniref:helix-turn-helix domain-containing protein n=1 Tax=Mammaliicoccus sciuri TaxID=1296 RepID=UPI001FB2F83A|nr:helix-turn-helix domain-containing protein [Mammaliicoccus sciuri]MCJ1783231.1 helix-turn-helix domain-containing protein [Mammaliicoccus sciuri]